MPLFLGISAAIKDGCTSCRPTFLIRDTVEKAFYDVHHECLEVYPLSAGYFGHQVKVEQISSELVRAAAKELDENVSQMKSTA